MPDVFGRTNLVLPRVWLSLSVPAEPSEGWLDALVGAAVDAETPIDISSSPGLWGGAMRGTVATLLTFGVDPASFQTRELAIQMTQAHLVETLSAVGREWIDFYIVRIRRSPEEFQIDGVLSALEEMREGGQVRFVGIHCDGPALATLGVWQFHDAFEALFVANNPLMRDAYQTLTPVAQERRVGVVGLHPLCWQPGVPVCGFVGADETPLLTAREAISLASRDHPALVGVRSPEEVRAAVEASTLGLPRDIDEKVSMAVRAYA